MSVYYTDDTVTVHHGDCLDTLATLPDASVDAVVTDPPYGLEFMGKEWDAPWKAEGTVLHDPSEVAGFQDGSGGNPFSRSRVRFGIGAGFQAWCELWATECLRVLRPGGHLLAFGGTRTSHRLTCAIEDAGFEIRDSIAWLYGSGFPKSLDVSKAIDKAAGAERAVVGLHPAPATPRVGTFNASFDEATLTAPATADAPTWQGWGTALKPAHEPIVVARKPLTGTVAANVLEHGTGAINIDGCRVGDAGGTTSSGEPNRLNTVYGDGMGGLPIVPLAAGRWPANVVLDESQAAALDQQSGEQDSRRIEKPAEPTPNDKTWAGGPLNGARPARGYTDSGGASRFFYTAKADAVERVRIDGTAHPTVKPLAIMRWLVRLVTPPGGVVLEPFAGSGTTVEACILEGFRCIAIEREADYLPLITQRIHRRRDPVAYYRAASGAATRGASDTSYGRMKTRECNVCANRTNPAGGKQSGRPWPTCGHEDWRWVEQLAPTHAAEDGGLFDLLGEEPA